MLNYTLFTNDKALVESFKKSSKIIGIIFLLLGLGGIFFPLIASLSTAIFFGWLLLFSGIIIGVHTFKTNKKDWIGWLKSVLLTIVGALTIINPIPGVAALGMLFSIYFFMDSFASIALAFSVKPAKNWIWILINGIISFILAIVFIINWPFSSLWLVGLFVGISLFFDGIVLLTMSSAIKDETKEA